MLAVALLHFAAVALVSAAPEYEVVRKVKRDATELNDPEPRVRRSNYYALNYASEESSDESSGPHCVVWGDWIYTGRRFQSKQEAAEFFKQKSRIELAAVHLRGFTEVRRFMSPRLKKVKWDIMKEWCVKHGDSSGSLLQEEDEETHDTPSRKIGMHVSRNGAISEALDDEYTAPSPSLAELRPSHRYHRSHPSEALDLDGEFTAPAPVRPRHPKFSPVTSPLSTHQEAGEAAADQASTLSGKASILEDQITELDTMTNQLLQTVGVGSLTFGSASLVQGGTRTHHQNPGNLHQRITSMEQGSTVVLAKTNALELELFGATTETKNEHKDSENSFKGKVATLTAQIEELKGKVSALVSSPLLSEAAKLEGRTTQLAEKARNIFSSIGVEGATAPAKPSGTPLLKSRLDGLEEYAEQLQRSAALLEYEILGSSWDLKSSAPSLKGASIKDHDTALGTKLTDLESRLASLASAPIVSDVGRMEKALTQLGSRAATLSTKVGAAKANTAGYAFVSAKGATLNTRIGSLNSGVEKMQSTIASLESELAGSVGVMPAHSQKGTMKGTVNFLELSVENINARMSAMEQQV